MKYLLTALIVTAGSLAVVYPNPPTSDVDAPPHWQPTPDTSWQIQFTGPLDASVNAQTYDIDLFDTPQSFIDELHAAGRRVVCYYSAGIYESWRPDAEMFHPKLLGNEVQGSPGERWLDIRHFKRLGRIMGGRLDLAVAKKCDGVQPDNVDSYTYDTGFPLTYQDQSAYNIWTAQQAHARGLAVGLTNDLLQITDLTEFYDFAINEQCFTFNECKLLTPFVLADKPVLQINYGYAEADFLATICPQAAALGFSAILKNPNLDAYRVACP